MEPKNPEFLLTTEDWAQPASKAAPSPTANSRTTPRTEAAGTNGSYYLPSPVFVDSSHWYQPGMGSSSLYGLAGLGTTSDAGKNWNVVSKDGPNGGSMVALDFADAQNGAALMGFEYDSGLPLFLTTDGGKTWQPADFSTR